MRNFTPRLLVAGAIALLFTPASAQFQQREKAAQNFVGGVALQQVDNSGVKAVQAKKNGPKLQVLSVKKASGTNDYANYGVMTEIFNEDFSKLTTGSEGDPDFNTNLYSAFKMTDPGETTPYEIPWYSFNPAYLNTKGIADGRGNAESRWGISNGYPAGGALYLYVKDDDEDTQSEQAHVNTCLIDCSKYQGDVVLQFDAYTDDAKKTNEISLVEAAETNGMGASWDVLGSAQLPAITNEKKTYTILYRGAGKSTIFNIVAQRGPLEQGGLPVGNSIYVDNVKVFSLQPYVNAPKNLTMKYYKGDNFKLEWDKVDGATKYLVDVYTKKSTTNAYGQVISTAIDQYLYQDEEVTDNFLNVTGATNGQTYFYRVRAVNASNQLSFESNEEGEILGVCTPVLEPVESTADSKYTARWKAVPGAEAYNYEAFAKNDITEDKKVELVNAMFAGMPYNHGFEMKITSYGEVIEQYSEPKYSTDNKDEKGYTSSFTSLEKVPGWMAFDWALYKDALVVDGFQSYYNNNNASLQCAAMDFSKDNGKFDVKLTLKAEDSGLVDQNNNPAYAHAALALFSYNQEKDTYEQSETAFISDLNDKEWKTSTTSFTKGTDNSIFGVFATYAPGNLYIHDMTITQNYKAGESFYEPFDYRYRTLGYPTDANGNALDGKKTHDELYAEVGLTGPTQGKDVYHRVQAVRLSKQAEQLTNATFAESYWSDPTLVAKNVYTGIQQATINTGKSATVFMQGNNLVVNNPEGAEVHVYSMSGVELNANKSGDTSVSLAVPAENNFIVKVGKQSIKISIVK